MKDTNPRPLENRPDKKVNTQKLMVPKLIAAPADWGSDSWRKLHPKHSPAMNTPHSADADTTAGLRPNRSATTPHTGVPTIDPTKGADRRILCHSVGNYGDVNGHKRGLYELTSSRIDVKLSSVPGLIVVKTVLSMTAP